MSIEVATGHHGVEDVDPPAVGMTDVQTVAALWRQPISRRMTWMEVER